MIDLQTYWFSKNESLIYQAWLELWTRTVSALARKTWLHRVVAYDTLQSLCKRGFASHIKKWKTWWYTMNPPSFIHETLLQKAKWFEYILPALENSRNTSWSWFDVQLFQWFDGLKALYDIIASSNTDLKIFLGAAHIDTAFREYLYNTYLPKRVRNWIHWYGICSHTSEDLKFANKQIVQQTDVITIDADIFELSCEIILFNGNMISLWSLWTWEMSWVLITSAWLHKSLTSIHDLIWKIHPKNWNQTFYK